jgi:hypothetical protein
MQAPALAIEALTSIFVTGLAICVLGGQAHAAQHGDLGLKGKALSVSLPQRDDSRQGQANAQLRGMRGGRNNGKEKT